MNTHLKRKIPAYDEKKMLQTIDAAKREYRRQMLLEPMTGFEFLFQQMLSLNKRYWLTQLIVFFAAAFSLGFMNLCNGISENKIRYCAIFAPLLIIFSIPELWKNISTNTYEVENTTYYDLRKVYLSRLVLVGMLDLIIATLLTGIIVHTSGFSAYEAVIYFFVPFNFNCCICFSLLCSRKICSELIAVSGCISGAVFWYLLVKDYHIYESLQMKTWYLLLVLSLLYIVFVGGRILESSRNYLEVCK